MKQQEIKKTRNYYFDILRIWACIMVIINHTNSWVFGTYYPELSGKLSLVLFFLCKTGVPIFFMISGALLLNKEESYKKVYGSRCLRIVFALIFGSLLFVENTEKSFFEDIVSGTYTTVYWYLYTYIGILLILPFLRKMRRSFSENDYIFFVGINFIVTVLLPFMTYLEVIPSVSGYLSLPFFTGPILYLFLGDFLHHYGQKLFIKISFLWKCIILIVCAAGSVIFSYMMTVQEYENSGHFVLALDNIYNMPIMICSASIFVLVQILFADLSIPMKLQKVILEISSCTFGIYLIHMELIEQTKELLSYLCIKINDWVAVLLNDILVFVLGLCIASILRRIPMLKKIL